MAPSKSKTDERTSLVRKDGDDASKDVKQQSDKTRCASFDIEQQGPLQRKLEGRRSTWGRVAACCRPQSFSWGHVAVALWLVTAGFLITWYRNPIPVASRESSSESSAPSFQVSFTAGAHAGPITGRLLVCVAKKSAMMYEDDEPRFLIGDYEKTQQLFGVDVFDFHAESEVRSVNVTSYGYPVFSLKDIPEDEYWVQAVLHPYVQYNRSDGQKLWLPATNTFESNEGVLTSPGTLYSKPQLMELRQDGATIALTIDHVTPELPPIEESEELLKHVKFRSPMLSKFWGTDIFIQAWVLLPHKFYDSSTQQIKYPLFIYHTHYSRDFEFDYRSTKPDESASAEELYGYYLYTNWTSESSESAFKYNRGILVQIQHANPYYDDSYAVNSANVGPYGDAITYEFLPYLEETYRGIGAGWARTMYGGSTGGWESFAVQVYYPDDYNGCWSFCPDSFDFRKFQLVDLLEDENAYYIRSDWTLKRRGSVRDYLGRVQETMEEENHHELVLGSRGRSGGQWDAWQAVYSPLNASDGYPAEVWNKVNGEINRDVVAYWEENYDVRVKLEREWNAKRLGEKLVNKLHVYVGVTDSYYLNDAVYYLDAFLKNTVDPYYNGSIVYGVRDGKGYEHCWTGSFDQTIRMGWNTLNQRMLPQMIEHIVRSAPAGADLSFTSY
ncbi:TPA: hypothetical protein N0F65_013051 [Lagenidium giganteum]|uniref:Uncharacterized protein n=1 Tax=Lagenidium giganteum TaxID=4803 RepID=A0AAV2YM35_9STRA|nr:TPA: hypothetical protein N0F65_013051 [Lagenidium giganteum]